ncbi:endonuclease [Geobacillus sp. 46C-IIa]|uniref:Uma2 family endonuclease n=1 Tax=Geobacillus sp. 46C-IIa TaxID=1963025 RepID=UPI0009C177BA|nr:Uma2 family endonuclease [Geobacillus sp. 46C-IIa]OQP05182.1 endonuclease [Geobacillus sp. 46C-IIa]QNU28106.1 Uma2 family endonuclease [Geobacillus sp. 46C-IIa]
MSLPLASGVSYERYWVVREQSDDRLEYIDRAVSMTRSPSVRHQLISSRLHFPFSLFFRGKPCDVLAAPLDVELVDERTGERNVVVPDLTVLCGEKGLDGTKYIGVPPLIVEILSPSNQAHDLVTKFNLYMACGVHEYWMVNPMKQAVTVYVLNEERLYGQTDVQVKTGTVRSVYFSGLEIDMAELFH